MLEGHAHAGQPLMLTEFGGIALVATAPRAWGYCACRDAGRVRRRATQSCCEVVRNLPLFAGFCYTQFADTYQEANGLLYADRTPKIPLEQIAEATAGATRSAAATEVSSSCRPAAPRREGR